MRDRSSFTMKVWTDSLRDSSFWSLLSPVSKSVYGQRFAKTQRRRRHWCMELATSAAEGSSSSPLSLSSSSALFFASRACSSKSSPRRSRRVFARSFRTTRASSLREWSPAARDTIAKRQLPRVVGSVDSRKMLDKFSQRLSKSFFRRERFRTFGT